MACSNCGRNKKPGIYKFQCKDCGEIFNISTTGIVVRLGINWYSKGINKVLLLCSKCKSNKINRLWK